jgi:hypothetical protein
MSGITRRRLLGTAAGAVFAVRQGGFVGEGLFAA